MPLDRFMLRIFSSGLYVLAVLGCTAVAAQEPCPERVRITFFDYPLPPLFHGSGMQFEQSPGLLVEWTQKAVQATGCRTRVELSRRPARRIHQELTYGQLDIIASWAVTPERLAIAEFPHIKNAVDTRMAYFATDTALWVRRGERSVLWDGMSLKGPPGFKVGVPPGTTMETMARSWGWAVDVGVNGPNTIEKLLRGRVPVTLISDAAIAAQPKEKRALLERLSPSVDRTLYYSAASKAFYAQYPEFMSRYWRGLCKASRAAPALPEQRQLLACP